MRGRGITRLRGSRCTFVVRQKLLAEVFLFDTAQDLLYLDNPEMKGRESHA